MSMTLKEAIKLLKQYQGYEPMFPDGEKLKHAFDLMNETVDTLLTALRPVSREQVEKVWRAHWNESTHLGGFVYCSRCGYNALEANNYTFCPKCGSPFTDEAVEMVMERLEALYETD